MPPGAASGDSGIWLALLTESFAVRALLGSLAAAALTMLAVRVDVVRSTRARRLLVLAPVLTAAAAGVATARQASGVYLPQLYVTSNSAAAGSGDLLELIGELRLIDLSQRLDLLVVGWASIAGVLLLRRLVGVLAVRRLVRLRTVPVGPQHRVVRLVTELAPAMGVRPPRVLLVRECPGGAFAGGLLRPAVAVDPALLDALDDRELEGLVAHELAHLRRRDPLLNLVVGLFRDVTFFLPSVLLAARWLRHEQEESADEVAAAVTTRPVALASGILKVWDRSALGAPRVACGAVQPPRLAVAGGGALVWRGRGRSEATRIVTRRIERLIAERRRVSPRRLAAEVTLAAAVLGAATGAAITVPQWIVERWETDTVAIGYVPAASAQPDQSEVFRTFNHLTRGAAAPASTSQPSSSTGRAGGCPCVESQAQLRAEIAATTPAPDPRLLWVANGHLPYEIRRSADVSTARSLFTVSDSGAHLGVFLVQQPPPAATTS